MFSKFISQKLSKQELNYKNILLLRKFISPEGKILPRRLTGLKTKQQRKVSRAIKNARVIGFLPFIRIALT